jgi:hypothetical protein
VVTRAVGHAALGATPMDTWKHLATCVDAPGLERHYACHCHQEGVMTPCQAPVPDPHGGAETPWRCAGHPPLTLPCEVFGVALGTDAWQRGVERLAWVHAMERRGSVGSALAAVFFALVGSDQDKWGEAMLAAVRSPDLQVRVRVLMAFSLLDVAPEWPRRLARLALDEPQWTQLSRPLAQGEEDPDWWAAASIAKIARQRDAVAEDRSLAVALLRRVALAHRGADHLAVSLAHLDPQWTAEHLVELAAVDRQQADSARFALKEHPEWHEVGERRLASASEDAPRG